MAPPVTHKSRARSGRTSPFSSIQHPKRRAYLTALVESGGNVTQACQIAQIDRSTPYTQQWRDNEEFQAALAVAKRMGADRLESEAILRAFEGIERAVGWYRGKAGGVVREYSDTLLIFLLKGAFPEKYADRQELKGQFAHIDFTKLPDEALSRIANGEHPASVLASLAARYTRESPQLHGGGKSPRLEPGRSES